jgi:peptidyl-prolyl cis-trans isomerase SurA
VINKIIDPVPAEFKDIQGDMLTGYQEFLENEWIKQLKKDYNVKIDSLILEEVKKNFKNE